MGMRALLVLSLCAACALSLDPAAYPNSLQLHSDFTMYWRVDGSKLFLGLLVKTTGWIGFGFSEPSVGSMPGADVLVSQVIDGKRTIEDRYTVAFAEPLPDDCQDWTFLAASTNADTNLTALEVSRPLDTGDNTQDRAVAPGVMRVIFAYT